MRIETIETHYMAQSKKPTKTKGKAQLEAQRQAQTEAQMEAQMEAQRVEAKERSAANRVRQSPPESARHKAERARETEFAAEKARETEFAAERAREKEFTAKRARETKFAAEKACKTKFAAKRAREAEEKSAELYRQATSRESASQTGRLESSIQRAGEAATNPERGQPSTSPRDVGGRVVRIMTDAGKTHWPSRVQARSKRSTQRAQHKSTSEQVCNVCKSPREGGE